MDFNRFGQNRPAQQNSAPAPQPAQAKPATLTDTPPATTGSRLSSFKHHGKAYQWSFGALLISGTILFIAMIFFIVFGSPINREARFVKGGDYQAVFVNVNGTNGGQVYFGRITDMNAQYIRLNDVFYIQNQTSQNGQANGSYNLVKLGCELHGPRDEMLINRDQVFFWENLKGDSQVAQKAAEFHKQNPNGQKCNANSGSTQQSGGTTQQPAQTGAPTQQGQQQPAQQQPAQNQPAQNQTPATPATPNTNTTNR